MESDQTVPLVSHTGEEECYGGVVGSEAPDRRRGSEGSAYDESHFVFRPLGTADFAMGQLLIVITFCVLVWTLSDSNAVVKTTGRLSAWHVAFAGPVVALGAWTSVRHRALQAVGYVTAFRGLGHTGMRPVWLVMAANGALLVIVGCEDVLFSAEHQSRRAVQVTVSIETFLLFIVVVDYVRRVRLFNRIKAPPEAFHFQHRGRQQAALSTVSDTSSASRPGDAASALLQQQGRYGREADLAIARDREAELGGDLEIARRELNDVRRRLNESTRTCAALGQQVRDTEGRSRALATELGDAKAALSTERKRCERLDAALKIEREANAEAASIVDSMRGAGHGVGFSMSE